MGSVGYLGSMCSAGNAGILDDMVSFGDTRSVGTLDSVVSAGSLGT